MIKVFIQGVVPEVKGRESKTEGGGGGPQRRVFIS